MNEPGYLRKSHPASQMAYKIYAIRSGHTTEEESMPIEEGKAAPAFSLKDAAGNKIALKDLRG